jgi:cell division protein FtsB
VIAAGASAREGKKLMSEHQPDYAALREHVEEALQLEAARTRRRLLVLNRTLFLVFVLVAWVGIPAAQQVGIPAAHFLGLLVLTLGWAVGLILHWLGDSAWLQRRTRERLTMREIEQDALRAGLLNLSDKTKRKHAETVRLVDDGELVAEGDPIRAENRRNN